MYPTIVVVLVETQRSMVDICEIGLSNAGKIAGAVTADHEAYAATLGPISFAVGPIDSVMDKEPESPPSRALQRRDVQERGLENDILEVNLKKSPATTSDTITR